MKMWFKKYNLYRFLKKLKLIETKFIYLNVSLFTGLFNSDFRKFPYDNPDVIGRDPYTLLESGGVGLFENTYLYYFLINDIFIYIVLSVVLMYHVANIKELKDKIGESFFTSNIYIYLFFVLFIVNLFSGIYVNTVLDFQIKNNAVFVLRLIVIIVYFLLFVLLKDYNFKSKKLKRFEIFFLACCSALILLQMACCDNFISLVILLEIFSLISYILVSHRNESLYSTEGGLKYFIIGSFSTGMIILGIYFFYIGSGGYAYGDTVLVSVESPFYNLSEVGPKHIQELRKDNPYGFYLAKIMHVIGHENFIYAVNKFEYYNKNVLGAESKFRTWSTHLNSFVFLEGKKTTMFFYGITPPMGEQWDRQVYLCRLPFCNASMKGSFKMEDIVADNPRIFNSKKWDLERYYYLVHDDEGLLDHDAVWNQVLTIRKRQSWWIYFKVKDFGPWVHKYLDSYDNDTEESFYLLQYLKRINTALDNMQAYRIIDRANQQYHMCISVRNRENVEAVLAHYENCVRNTFSENGVVVSAIDEENLALLRNNDWFGFIDKQKKWDTHFLAKNMYLSWDFTKHSVQENEWFLKNHANYYLYGLYSDLFGHDFGAKYLAYVEWKENQRENKLFNNPENKEFRKAVENLNQHVDVYSPDTSAEFKSDCLREAISEGTMVNYSPHFYDPSKGPLQTVTIDGITMNKEALSWKWLKDYDHDLRQFEIYLVHKEKIRDAINHSLLGIVFIFVGLLLKLGVAPFHIWTPDVYEGADIWVMSFLSIIPKCVIFLVLFSLASLFDLDIFVGLKMLISICVVCSIFVGAVGGLVQSSIQRLLVYSGIANLAFFACVFVADSAGGVSSLLHYMFLYIMVMIPLFGCFMFLRNRCTFGIMKNYYSFSNIFVVTKFLAYIIAILLFCLSGLPPLAFFFAKFYVLYTLFHFNAPTVVIVILSVTSVNIFYYVRLIKMVILSRSEDCLFVIDLESNGSVIVVTMCLFNIFFIIIPNFLIFYFYDFFLFLLKILF